MDKKDVNSCLEITKNRGEIRSLAGEEKERNRQVRKIVREVF